MSYFDQGFVMLLAGIPALGVALGHPSFVVGWLIGAAVIVLASLIGKRRP